MIGGSLHRCRGRRGGADLGGGGLRDRGHVPRGGGSWSVGLSFAQQLEADGLAERLGKRRGGGKPITRLLRRRAGDDDIEDGKQVWAGGTGRGRRIADVCP